MHRRGRKRQWPGVGHSIVMLGTVLACIAAAHAGPRCPLGPSEPYTPWVFFGYACQGACGEQKAGFAWAERNGIGNAAACLERTGGFAEGCRTYAEFIVTPEQAGFEWARENELTDGCECGGAGGAFRAGCEAYLDAIGD